MNGVRIQQMISREQQLNSMLNNRNNRNNNSFNRYNDDASQQEEDTIFQGDVPDDLQLCSICQDVMIQEDSANIRRCIHCKQLFHTDCIAEWLKLNKKCPLCRGDWPINDSIFPTGTQSPQENRQERRGVLSNLRRRFSNIFSRNRNRIVPEDAGIDAMMRDPNNPPPPPGNTGNNRTRSNRNRRFRHNRGGKSRNKRNRKRRRTKNKRRKKRDGRKKKMHTKQKQKQKQKHKKTRRI